MPISRLIVVPFSEVLTLLCFRLIFFVGKMKQLSPTQSEIHLIDRVRLKAPTADRVYPQFLLTENLFRANLVSHAESKCASLTLYVRLYHVGCLSNVHFCKVTDARRAAKAKRMNESSRRYLMLGL